MYACIALVGIVSLYAEGGMVLDNKTVNSIL